MLIAEFPTYGYRRICARLRRRETLTVNRKQVYQLMREQRWTVPQRQASPKPRVQQARSRTERSNERWEMDIAHVACGADGWGHLGAVIDCTTARVWAGSSPCADGARKRNGRWRWRVGRAWGHGGRQVRRRCCAVTTGWASFFAEARRAVRAWLEWSFTKVVRLPKVNHPVRVFVLWSSADATEARKVLVTNRILWETHRILKVYTRRWSGTETYHRDGKQHLGVGDGQLRDGVGQPRHMDLVMVVYTPLMRQMKPDRARDGAHTPLMTIGESWRAIARDTLAKTLAWAVQQAQHGLSLPDNQHRLALA